MSIVTLASDQPAQPPGSMLEQLMAETALLAEDAKSYIVNRPARPAHAAPLPSLVETAEISRVTARVSHCMAWLLARNAVANGELTMDKSLEPEWRLADQDCCGEPIETAAPLPPVLQRLSDRSLALYERIARLDGQLDRQS